MRACARANTSVLSPCSCRSHVDLIHNLMHIKQALLDIDSCLGLLLHGKGPQCTAAGGAGSLSSAAAAATTGAATAFPAASSSGRLAVDVESLQRLTAKGLCRRGDALMGLARCAEAAAAYEEGLVADPFHPGCQVGLAAAQAAACRQLAAAAQEAQRRKALPAPPLLATSGSDASAAADGIRSLSPSTAAGDIAATGLVADSSSSSSTVVTHEGAATAGDTPAGYAAVAAGSAAAERHRHHQAATQFADDKTQSEYTAESVSAEKYSSMGRLMPPLSTTQLPCRVRAAPPEDVLLPAQLLLSPFQAERDERLRDVYNYVTVQVGVKWKCNLSRVTQ